MNIVSVAAGICYRSKSILIGRRHQLEKRFAGFWEFPGGKMEAGETALQALEREFQEELGCSIRKVQEFEKMEWRYPDRIVDLHFFLVRLDCENLDGLELNAHSELKWVSILEAKSMDVLPANVHILNKLEKDEAHVQAFSECD